MNKNFIAFILLALVSQGSYAETCPTVKDIKNHMAKGWKAFDSEEDKPLIAERDTQFRKDIREFVLAEWVQGAKKGGTIHCYYRNADGGDMEAYMTKDNFIPNNEQNLWYQVSGAMQCAAGTDKCQFKTIGNESRLAKRD